MTKRAQSCVCLPAQETEHHQHSRRVRYDSTFKLLISPESFLDTRLWLLLICMIHKAAFWQKKFQEQESLGISNQDLRTNQTLGC